MKKHILCIGDSNTHGYCADPSDCADGGIRYNESERWPCLLQQLLGPEYLVTEEGLSGRTTVFEDPIHEGMPTLPVLVPLLKSHETVDLLVLMLGTNDTKERFNASAALIAQGMVRLVQKARTVDCWGEHEPRILIVAPPPIGEAFYDEVMGEGCVEKSRGLAAWYSRIAEQEHCFFMDADGCEFNSVDHMHLTKNGHARLAERLSEFIRELGL